MAPPTDPLPASPLRRPRPPGGPALLPTALARPSRRVAATAAALAVAATAFCAVRPWGALADDDRAGGGPVGVRAAVNDGAVAGDLTRVLDPGLRQRQTAFLEQIRQSDPEHKTIDKAVFNERNELALMMNRQVGLDDIPKLMRVVLTKEAKAFPGQDLTVIAYTPPNGTNAPLKIGTGRLNARTRDLSYTPARPPR